MAKKVLPDFIPLLRRMWLIRTFEEKASLLYSERQIAGLLHLSIGQEAVAVGACSLLRKDDYVFGGHGALLCAGLGTLIRANQRFESAGLGKVAPPETRASSSAGAPPCDARTRHTALFGWRIAIRSSDSTSSKPCFI